MNWITLSEADVLTVVNASELEAWRSIATSFNQADPLPMVIADVVLYVRGYCMAKVTLGPVGTVPESLKSCALDLVSVRLPRRVGLEDTETRRNIERAAVDLLKAVVSGGFETGAPERAGKAGIAIAASQPRTASNAQLDGLL